MGYEVEEFSVMLKRAREMKGLSQRDLSARSGVPQSHISKIETSGVDLRISSLVSIANALDLEIALVPRKAVPAVKSISRSVGIAPQTLPNVAKQMAQIAKQLEGARALNIDMSALSDVQRQFREMRQFQNLIQDIGALRHIRKAMQAATGSDGIAALQEAGRQMASVRNTLAHIDIKPNNLPRAAYHLDGDDDG